MLCPVMKWYTSLLSLLKAAVRASHAAGFVHGDLCVVAIS